jgi:uncharacterized protein YdcH (DUF465 family)
MSVEHHPLIKDFPELRDRIHAMKGQTHFAKLEKEYEEVDKQIVRAENRVENLSDDQIETLKQQRVRLKDELYKLLTA